MYLDYFGLSRLPFSIAPDPELLYLSPSHHEALAHLNYALTAHGGLICLTGEVGMGKTTLCRAFIDQVPAHVDIAYIFNPMLSAPELLQAICSELEIPCDHQPGEGPLTNKQLIDRLYQSLIERYARGRKVICIIDEAQSMPAPLLEQIRLLTNLETNRDKLLTLILVGQPELQDILSQHSTRQLDQRITARFHLPSMNQKQLKPYLQHRLKQAGSEKELFSKRAISAIWTGARGIPRLINSIADRALLGAYATNQSKVSKVIALQAIKEVVGQPKRKTVIGLTAKGLKGLGLFGLTAVVVMLLVFGQQKTAWVNGLNLDELWGMNPYQKLAEVNGLDVEASDLSSCNDIKENSEFACLPLDWPLAELKKLQQYIAIFEDGNWRVVTADQLTFKPLRSFILWQPVENFGKSVKPGESHSLITWIRNVLTDESASLEWQIIAPEGAPEHDFQSYYDPILAQKVSSFQQSAGLKADRIIGLKTLLALQAKSQGILMSDGEG
ncbi:Peptidoglycan-binding domain 1 protein [Oleispira antarctica RB-8]|uniref:Peptidoglycan-binding domain 1 protein n=1 Tax=Oleispira antarctica RB-8 TaxID=698738 RepID=R4YSI5_OLEAN|nr:Peptidoglycan-binding domain 1 protein [Oleispira antarctica RB-8]